jgi:hypothetical protein
MNLEFCETKSIISSVIKLGSIDDILILGMLVLSFIAVKRSAKDSLFS